MAAFYIMCCASWPPAKLPETRENVMKKAAPAAFFLPVGLVSI
jgi:hypothetical protein